MRKIVFLGFILLAVFLCVDSAHALPKVTIGVVDGIDYSGAARFKSFGNTGSREIYVGKGDLGVGANRSEADHEWIDENVIVFSYDPYKTILPELMGTLIAAAASDDDATWVDYDAGKLGPLNAMQLDIYARDDDVTVSMGPSFLTVFDKDGGPTYIPFSEKVEVGPEFDKLTLTVTDIDLTHGFYGQARLNFDGVFPSGRGDENSKVQLMVGYQAVPEPGTFFMLGLGLFGLAVCSRRKFKK